MGKLLVLMLFSLLPLAGEPSRLKSLMEFPACKSQEAVWDFLVAVKADDKETSRNLLLAMEVLASFGDRCVIIEEGEVVEWVRKDSKEGILTIRKLGQTDVYFSLLHLFQLTEK